MGVDATSQWHQDNLPTWQKCRAAMAGAEAVRDGGETYLPRPSGLDATEYDAYLLRATYLNATQRTHDSLVGMVMGKPAEQKLPPRIEEMGENINGEGSRIEDFARMAVSEAVEVGGGLAVVDHPERPEGIVTAAQERALGLRPFATWYPLESVMEWREATIGGEKVITFLKLWETWQYQKDEWTVEDRPQIRVYDLDGGVRVRVFRKAESSSEWELHSEAWPRIASGQQLQRIPAVFFGPIKNEPGKPVLLDLVEVNFSHYRNSADREHAAHITSLPTPYVAGYMPEENEVIRLGSTAAYCFSDPQAKMDFATYGADGVGVLRDLMTEKVGMMAALGARVLMPEGGSAESGEALAIRRGGENSALAKVADSVSRSVALVLGILRDWVGVTGDISYSLNTDYLPNNMDAQEMTAIIQSVQAGLMSMQEAFEAFKAGGVIRDDKIYEDHAEEMQGLADPVIDEPD